MQAEQANAIKRVMLKRYLIRVGCKNLLNALTTKKLQSFVRFLHRKRVQKFGKMSKAWPLTKLEIENIAKNSHYVWQLLQIKCCFGPQARIGIVEEDGETIQCQTVRELIAANLCKEKFLVLDWQSHNYDYVYQEHREKARLI